MYFFGWVVDLDLSGWVGGRPGIGRGRTGGGSSPTPAAAAGLDGRFCPARVRPRRTRGPAGDATRVGLDLSAGPLLDPTTGAKATDPLTEGAHRRRILADPGCLSRAGRAILPGQGAPPADARNGEGYDTATRRAQPAGPARVGREPPPQAAHGGASVGPDDRRESDGSPRTPTALVLKLAGARNGRSDPLGYAPNLPYFSFGITPNYRAVFLGKCGGRVLLLRPTFSIILVIPP